MTTVQKVGIMQGIRDLSDSEWEELKAKWFEEDEQKEQDELKDFFGNNNVEKKVYEFVKELGVPFKLKGRRQIIMATTIILQSRENVDKNIIEVFAEVAKEYNTNTTVVENNIRAAIALLWKDIDQEKIFEVFGKVRFGKVGRPSAAEFVQGLAEYIYYN